MIFFNDTYRSFLLFNNVFRETIFHNYLEHVIFLLKVQIWVLKEWRLGRIENTSGNRFHGLDTLRIKKTVWTELAAFAKYFWLIDQYLPKEEFYKALGSRSHGHMQMRDREKDKERKRVIIELLKFIWKAGSLISYIAFFWILSRISPGWIRYFLLRRHKCSYVSFWCNHCLSKMSIARNYFLA